MKHEIIPALFLALRQTDEGKRAARGRCKDNIFVTKGSLNFQTAAPQTLKLHVHIISQTWKRFTTVGAPNIVITLTTAAVAGQCQDKHVNQGASAHLTFSEAS